MVYNGKELEEFIVTPGRKTRLEDLSGKTFGSLKVICRAPNSNGSTMYWCECTACGRVGKYFSSHLKSGATTKCRVCAKTEQIEKKFKGFGDIPLTYWTDLKRGAAGEKSSRKSRHTKKFLITIEQAWQLFLDQDRRCALSGVELTFCKYRLSVSSERKKWQTASLDRIDSDGDYAIDNVQWVHKDINRMKNTFSNDYFVEMCSLIADNFKN